MLRATGARAFILAAVADNLTTALVMGLVVATVGLGQPRFFAVGLVNVVAANAFGPFGDLPTRMVRQAGMAAFFALFALVVPSLAAYLLRALWMRRQLQEGRPVVPANARPMHRGSKRTVALAVFFEQVLALPAYLGIIMGLSILQSS